MDFHLLIQGIILGFSIAAPVGPIGLLCIQRTLTQGRWSGLISGLGAALADTIYGCIAGWGLSIVSQFLVEQQNEIRCCGGILLIYLGGKILLEKPAEQPALTDHRSWLWNLASTFFLTLTNPMTILFFAATFSALGNPQPSHSLLIVLGVTIGSTLWWFILTSTVSLIQKVISPQFLPWLHYASGVTLIAFGVYGVYSAGLF